MRWTRAIVAVVALAGAGCPLGPFSGGHLRGDVYTQRVSDWTFVEDAETCQLETNPDAPHSVNTWCTGWRGNLYIPTSMILGPPVPAEREWVRNVQSEPDVRVRVDGMVYELVAKQVSNDSEYAAVLVALEAKYELDHADRDPAREIWIFRLESR